MKNISTSLKALAMWINNFSEKNILNCCKFSMQLLLCITPQQRDYAQQNGFCSATVRGCFCCVFFFFFKTHFCRISINEAQKPLSWIRRFHAFFPPLSLFQVNRFLAFSLFYCGLHPVLFYLGYLHEDWISVNAIFPGLQQNYYL